ncbi:MAG: NPCBM/NEW2 domain-containing protein [Thermoguttaceae bacterium]
MRFAFLLIICLVASASAADVEVVDVHGECHVGTLASCDAAGVALRLQTAPSRDEQRDERLPAEAITTLRVLGASSVLAVPKVRVVCRDGSLVAADNFESQDGATITLTTPLQAEPLTVPLAAVAAVRFDNASDRDRVWNDLVREHSASDRLVIAQGDFADCYDGIVKSVSAGRVNFEAAGSGETLAIATQKLVGVIYAQTTASHTAPPAAAHIETRDGSRFVVHQFESSGEMLTLETVERLRLTFPFSDVTAIQFTPTRRIPLADLTPVSMRASAIFVGDLRNVSLDLASVAAKTEIEYRVDSEVVRLSGSVKIARRSIPFGKARFIVRGVGERVLGEWTLSGDSPPLPIDIDVSGIQQVVIVVDFPNGIPAPGALVDLRSLSLCL